MEAGEVAIQGAGAREGYLPEGASRPSSGCRRELQEKSRAMTTAAMQRATNISSTRTGPESAAADVVAEAAEAADPTAEEATEPEAAEAAEVAAEEAAEPEAAAAEAAATEAEPRMTPASHLKDSRPRFWTQ